MDRPLITEQHLIEINGLVARVKAIEVEYLKTHSVDKSRELYTRMDDIRAILLTDYGVTVDVCRGRSTLSNF